MAEFSRTTRTTFFFSSSSHDTFLNYDFFIGDLRTTPQFARQFHSHGTLTHTITHFARHLEKLTLHDVRRWQENQKKI